MASRWSRSGGSTASGTWISAWAERLIIECDSRAHHAHPAGYATDRLRDRRLVALGYQVVRLTWEDVMLRWDETSQFLLDLVRRRVHRATPAGRSSARAAPT